MYLQHLLRVLIYGALFVEMPVLEKHAAVGRGAVCDRGRRGAGGFSGQSRGSGASFRIAVLDSVGIPVSLRIRGRGRVFSGSFFGVGTFGAGAPVA